MNEQEQPSSGELEQDERGTPNPDALKAARERDEAAAEQPEPDEPPVPAPEPDEPDPTSKAIAEAHHAYISAIAAALGPEAEIAPCPTCSGMGFNPVRLEHDQHRERCPECGGWGQVETGSLVESQRVLACQGCNGQGWRQVLVHVGGQPTTTAMPVPIAPPYTPPPPAPPQNAQPSQVLGSP